MCKDSRMHIRKQKNCLDKNSILWRMNFLTVKLSYRYDLKIENEKTLSERRQNVKTIRGWKSLKYQFRAAVWFSVAVDKKLAPLSINIRQIFHPATRLPCDTNSTYSPVTKGGKKTEPNRYIFHSYNQSNKVPFLHKDLPEICVWCGN